MAKKVDTYGLKMDGLKYAAGETKGCVPYGPLYVQISYDTEDGQVLAVTHAGNSCTRYNGVHVIPVCDAHGSMTMQEIADAVADAVERHLPWLKA